MPRWEFKEATPGDRARESQVEKFFRSAVVHDPANAMVREGIQNTLDASNDDEAALVRITLGQWSADEFAERQPVYENGLAEHIQCEAAQRKLPGLPSHEDNFGFLTFEDFNTCGLSGDPAEWWPAESGSKNAFFNYFRGEGISGKEHGDRGRHGVGRLVFMFASRTRTLFGLTRRADDGQELLMGTTVLCNHHVGGQPYLPDGWFGERAEKTKGLTLPVGPGPDGFVEQFKRDFRLTRVDEPGLSVVVPWLADEITAEQVVSSAVEGYFYPILRGNLAVEVLDDAGKQTRIDAESLDRVVDAMDAENAARIRPLLSLARASLAATDVIELPRIDSGKSLKWSDELVPEPIREKINAALSDGGLAAVRVPISITERGKPAAESHFMLFLERDPTLGDSSITFVREGIIVLDPTPRPRRTSGVRALVVIDDEPLGTFLGDSENPAHTDWQADAVKEKYYPFKQPIDFVVQAVPRLLSILNRQEKKPDPTLLIDLFHLPADEGLKAKGNKPKKPSGGESGKPPIDVPPRFPAYRTEQTHGGFVIRRGHPKAKSPERLSVRVAYSVRRGSAFAKYDPADFRIGLGGVEASVEGCKIAKFDANWMELQVLDPDFRLEVTGFDTAYRDLEIAVQDLTPKPDADRDDEDAEHGDAAEAAGAGVNGEVADVAQA